MKTFQCRNASTVTTRFQQGLAQICNLSLIDEILNVIVDVQVNFRKVHWAAQFQGVLDKTDGLCTFDSRMMFFRFVRTLGTFADLVGLQLVFENLPVVGLTLGVFEIHLV